MKILYNIASVLYKQDKSQLPREVPPVEQIEKKEEEEEEGPHQGEDEDWAKQSAKPSFAVQILQKAQHFISIESREIRLLVLDTIKKSLFVVSKRDYGHLLPAIHAVWPALRRRFRDKDQPLLIKSLEIVVLMCQEAKEFLASRFKEDLFPVLKNLLKESALDGTGSVSLTITEEAPTGQSLGKFSSKAKLRVSILRTLRSICKYMELPKEIYTEIAQLTRVFLNHKQYEEVQQEAISLFQQIAQVDSDSIWFSMHQLIGSTFLPPTAAELQLSAGSLIIRLEPITLPSPKEWKPQEYIQNANLILNYIQKLRS
jgi:hypothetical protein